MNFDCCFQAVNDLVTELEEANITCRATITFSELDFKDQLLHLRASIIIPSHMYAHTLRQAHT
jgi:hypothetical protein